MIKLNTLRLVLSLFVLLLVSSAIAQPIASFTADTPAVCASTSFINFTNTSTGATSYYWDFGDNTNSSATNPSRYYNIPGPKTVTLIAYNGGQSDTSRLTLTIFNNPKPEFALVRDTICPGTQVCGINQTILGDAPVDTCFWDFGLPGVAPLIDCGSPCYTTSPNLAQGSYQVSLIVIDENGCIGNNIKPGYLKVRPAPVACFNTSTFDSCSGPQSITFTNCSSHGTPGTTIGYQWTINSSTTPFSTAPNPPARTFNCGALDTVKLTANDPAGCRSTVSKPIKVTCINTDFTLPSNTICKSQPIVIQGISTGTPIVGTDTMRYSWLITPGSSAYNTKTISHTFTQNGTINIRLINTLNGCRDTAIKSVTVTDSIPLDFTADRTQKCTPPLTVNFQCSAPGASSTSWNYGDPGNNGSPLCNATFTYQTQGCYDVTLTATNQGGCISRLTKPDFICVQAFNASIAASANGGCAPLPVTFTNSTQINQPIDSCTWGIGNTVYQKDDCSNAFNFTFANPGTYNVWLRLKTLDGCFDTAYTTITVTTPPAVDFVANPDTSCTKQPISFTCLNCGSVTSYNWDFGPGTSTLPNPTTYYDDIGSHTITLVATNGNCSTTVVKPNYVVTLLPQASFTIEKSCADAQTFTFNSKDSQGADSIWWDLGPSAPSTFTNIDSFTYTFPAGLQYTVSLYVKNLATGCIDSVTRTISLTSTPVDFSVNKQAGCIGNTFNFTDESTFGKTWRWSFGDGSTSTLQNPTHTYKATGRYTVKLVVDPGSPCSDSLVKTQYITISKPDADFVGVPRSGCRPLEVTFTNLSSDTAAPIVRCRWTYGTGGNATFDTVCNPIKLFNLPQTSYNVTLIVTDSAGCRDTITKNNYINVKVIRPNFNLPSVVCAGRLLTFTNTTLSPVDYTYHWDFGDNTTSTAINATHTYSTSGSYDVTLTAIDKNDTTCKVSVTKVLEITGLGLNFNVTSNIPCPPAPAIITNLTQDTAVKFTWYYGDGSSSNEQNVTHAHIYYYPGEYDITLVGQHPNGCRDSLTRSKAVVVLGPRLENIAFDPPFGCRPVTVNFSGMIHRAQSGIVEWSPGVTSTINVVFGDTLYYDTSYVYTDTSQLGYQNPTLLIEDDRGCKVSYPLIDSFYIDEYPLPNQRDTSICIGATVEYNLPDGDFFLWEVLNPIASGDSNTYLTCDTCMFTVSNAPDTITYVVTATTIWGCVARDTIQLNVEDLPKLNFQPDSFFRLCRGETRDLYAGDVYNVLWTNIVGNNLNLSSTTSLTPTAYANDTTIWELYSENRLGCSITDTARMFVIDTVKVDFIPDTSICSGESILLDISVREASINDTAFYWFPAAYLDNPNKEDPIASPPFTMTFNVRIESTVCEPDTHSFEVRVDPLPDIELYTDTVIAVGTELDLAALSNDAITYEWTSIDPLTCYDCETPTLSATYTQWVSVKVTNQFGCEAIDSAYIRVLPCTPDFVFIPTAFTPNGDGMNDILYARGKALKELKNFVISNRWGNIVYSSNNIKEGWDGTYRGSQASTDAYVWYIKGVCTNGQEVEKKGTVTLIR